MKVSGLFSFMNNSSLFLLSVMFCCIFVIVIQINAYELSLLVFMHSF